ncbi:cobalt-precorrin-6A reductase [Kribbella sp. NPDC051952]|uniref:cobalt-precorrin-6A reductase n=1 Tax=Kribbella sp. NPDC051952 TaxID=3154851 RepID=UPI003447F98D
MKVLLLGGTGEARALAQLLVSAGVEVVSSLAGRTADARLPVGGVRTGGFGGVDGLSAWLLAHPVDAVVDATHPFAATMTAHAVAAAGEVGVPLLILRRPGWTAAPDDTWHWVDTPSAAAELLPTLGSRPFLTIGRQGLPAFAPLGLQGPSAVAPLGLVNLPSILARCVDAPEPLPTWCTLLLARGPFDLTAELDLMRLHQIDVLVTKDSGGPATSAKLTAARELHIPVIVIRRPPLPAGVEVVTSADEALAWTLKR